MQLTLLVICKKANAITFLRHKDLHLLTQGFFLLDLRPETPEIYALHQENQLLLYHIPSQGV